MQITITNALEAVPSEIPKLRLGMLRDNLRNEWTSKDKGVVWTVAIDVDPPGTLIVRVDNVGHNSGGSIVLDCMLGTTWSTAVGL